MGGQKTKMIAQADIANRIGNETDHQWRYRVDKGWLHFTQSNWLLDRTDLIKHEALRQVALQVGQSDQRSSALSHAFVDGAIKLAKSRPELATTADAWDRNSFLVGAQNGTIDLRTGEFRQARADDMISRRLGVDPADTEEAPHFFSFLDFAFDGDASAIAFLQRWFGYCLTAEMSEQKLVYLFGPGGNGKGVLIRSVLRVLGEYGRIAPESTLTARGHTHPSDIAFLEGLRFVAVTETEVGSRFREGVINSVTGMDPLTPRHLNRDFFTFIPQCKITISGNTVPSLAAVNDAARRRFLILPMTRKPEKPDPELEIKLQSELPGILRWMINGCIAWQNNRLGSCDAIDAMTRNYFEQQDIFASWLETSANLDPAGFTPVKDLYESWRSFLAEIGEDHEHMRTFGNRLTNAGFKSHVRKIDNKSHRGRKGIVLVTR